MRKIPILVTALILSLALPPAAATAQDTLALWAGQGDGPVSMNGFVADPALSPGTARVAVGTTVTWTIGSDEPHTITFLAGGPRPDLLIPQPESMSLPPMANPQVFFPMPSMAPWDGSTYLNSSPLGRDQTFSVTFAKAGTYPYVCMFHLPMTGTIEVVAPGAAGITTQAAVNGYAATHMAAAHQPQVDQLLAMQDHPVGMPNGNGTTTWYVRAGTDWPYGHLDILSFLGGQNLMLGRGDTVVWYNANNGVPHTVTFLNGHDPLPDFVPTLPDGTMLTPEMMMSMPPPDPTQPMDPAMLPRLIAGPGVFPAGGPIFDPTGISNSGLIGYLNPAGVATYSLTFNSPGSFDYFCVFHEGTGMRGNVTVA